MSKKTKVNNRNKRLQVKRAKKAANQAHYAELKRQGLNSGSRRARMSSKKRRKRGSVDHPNGFCGNIGCRKCFPSQHEYWDKIQSPMLGSSANPFNILRKIV
jgi:hypothetical protein